MNLFERSIAYITRKKTRSIIILLILSIITSGIYTCLSISRATKNLEQKLLTASNSSFTILKNPNTTGIETNDIIKNITNRNIKSINFKRSTDVQLQTGVVINQNQKIQLDNTGHNLSNLLKLHSVTNSNKENAFTSEAFTLIGGSHIDNAKGQRQVIIHEKLANKNNWKIGDKIIISELTDNNIKNQLTIVGIFSGQIQEEFNGLSSDLSENTIYASLDQNNLVDSATFFVDQPEKIDQIIAEIKKSPLDWQNIDIVKNTKAFEAITSNIKTIKAIIKAMIVGILIASIVALSLILTLWLRERIYEIGILLAIGQTKLAIICQFIIELILTSFPAVIIAVFLGNFLSAQFLAHLLATEDLNKLTSGPPVNLIDIENLTVISASLAILLIVIISAVLITSFAILSQKPKKILSKIS